MCENEMASEAQLRELFPDRMSSDEFKACDEDVTETIVGFVALVGQMKGAEPAESTPAEIHAHMVEMAKGLHELSMFTATLLREVKELPRPNYAPPSPWRPARPRTRPLISEPAAPPTSPHSETETTGTQSGNMYSC
jgi:hypothetical protein